MFRTGGAEQVSPSGEGKISHTFPSKNASYERNRIIVRAWDEIKNPDRSNTHSSRIQSILIASSDIKILCSLKKTQGQDYEFSVQRVGDNETLPRSRPLYTYSFYTLSPEKLDSSFQTMQNDPPISNFTEENAERTLVYAAWQLLKGAGMDQLVRIKSEAYEGFHKAPPTTGEVIRPRSVSPHSLKSLQYFGWDTYGKGCHHGGGLLSAAKGVESRIIKLSVPGEAEIMENNCQCSNVACSIS